ncbi:MAG: threonylcarbamoyl-AMP synthase [Aeromicrobium sp.]|nr:threonylcarbamoyl-AMP synthase [Burkholderiales bacterium]
MPTKKQITEAANALTLGELVVMPTETVYGLAADATNEAAVKRIFAAKGRPADHPLIVHVRKGDDLSRWAKRLPSHVAPLIAAFWPGPLTLILKKTDAIPDVVTGGQNTVGLRCPAHPVAQALLDAFAKHGSGIVAAPSANRFGHVSPTTAAHVISEFGELINADKTVAVKKRITLLDGGACDVGIESTILDLSGKEPVLLRPGAVSAEDIARVIGVMPKSREAVQLANGVMPRVSGDLAAHYAPRTPLQLLTAAALVVEVDAMLAAAKRVAVLAFAAKPKTAPSPVGIGVRHLRPLIWLQAPKQVEDYARDLYASLRTLDAAGTSMIIVEAPPSDAAWDAVNDRLSRAAVGAGKRP